MISGIGTSKREKCMKKLNIYIVFINLLLMLVARNLASPFLSDLKTVRHEQAQVEHAEFFNLKQAYCIY